MNFNETYVQTLEQGLEALGQISDPYSRAMAAAALATAMTCYREEESQTAESATAVETEQPAPKRSRKKAEPVVAEPETAPAMAEEAAAEPEVPLTPEPASEPVDAAWTEADYKKYESQLALINGALTEHGEENMNAWVADFSNGCLNSIQDISPVNIEAFYTYLTAN